LPWRKCGFDPHWALLRSGCGKAWNSAGVGSRRTNAARRCPGSNPATLTDSMRCGLTVRQLPVKETIAGSIPAAAAWGDKPIGDGSCFENSRAQALGVQLPLPPLTCPWPSGKCASLPSWRGGFNSHRALLLKNTIGDRLTVGCLALNQVVEVQILLPELGHSRECLLQRHDPG
jgi:hypothetical protein